MKAFESIALLLVIVTLEEVKTDLSLKHFSTFIMYAYIYAVKPKFFNVSFQNHCLPTSENIAHRTGGHAVLLHDHDINLSAGMEAPICIDQQENGRAYILICKSHWDVTQRKLEQILQMMYKDW